MINNKKGLSDIVTTVLIILLVAVAVAAVWAFVAPSLSGTGKQFTKTQVCISNIIEPVTCEELDDAEVSDDKSTEGTGTVGQGGKETFPVDVRVRRTLSDGVTLLKEYRVEVIGTDSIPVDPTVSHTASFLSKQGEVEAVAMGTTEALIANAQAKVVSTYELPDGTIVPCTSLPILCVPTS